MTAVDELGQTGLGSKTVTITYAVDPPIANFVSAPNTPKAGDTVTFNASASTVGVGATIATYTWDFGDGASTGDEYLAGDHHDLCLGRALTSSR